MNMERKINVSNEWEKLQLIYQAVFNLNKGNISQTVQSIIDIFDENYSFSYNIIISQLIYLLIVTKMFDMNLSFDFLKEIEAFERKNNIKFKIFDVFSNYLYYKFSQESIYLLENMLKQNLIGPEIVKKTENILFEDLSNDDWEVSKKLILEGINPNEIVIIIRNDDVEKLQEISTQSDFDFNQTIEPSLYERCTFVNQEDVTIIDYAAFFSAVKCFKYLLINGAKVENTGKYAIAGGNEEIIHLCEQNHSTFFGAYETAIAFHRNDIFHYFYDNKIFEINKLEKFGKKCISHHNYEIFKFLQEKGMKINKAIINKSAKIGNFFLMKYFLEFNQVPKKILIFLSESGNIEIINYILQQKVIDINAKGICFFYI